MFEEGLHSTGIFDSLVYLLNSCDEGKVILSLPPSQIFGRGRCWRLREEKQKHPCIFPVQCVHKNFFRVLSIDH